MDFSKLTADVHSIASVLKRFFQELPDPLVPWEFGQPMIAIYSRFSLSLLSSPLILILSFPLMYTDEHSESEDLINLHAGAINRMPAANSAVFKILIKFLYSVTEYSSENQMTARNLGILSSTSLFPVLFPFHILP